MSLGLTNTKLGAGFPQQQLRISRQYKVAPSIAEQAIFIPKPYKRVSFELVLQPRSLPGGGDGIQYEPIPLPGSDKTPDGDVSGANIARGDLGVNGLTARFDNLAWQGRPGGYVRMEVDLTPNKQYDVIATQEEGRQINNRQIHFSQQYDSYGRPRIGFSREPYDFAATKYVSLTSQLSFQRNVADTKEQFDQYLAQNKDEESKPEVQLFGTSDKAGSKEVPIFGATSDNEKDRDTNEGSGDFFLGAGQEKRVSVGVDRVTAEESYQNQKVEVIDVFGDGGNRPAATDEKDNGDNSPRNIDLTA